MILQASRMPQTVLVLYTFVGSQLADYLANEIDQGPYCVKLVYRPIKQRNRCSVPAWTSNKGIHHGFLEYGNSQKSVFNI